MQPSSVDFQVLRIFAPLQRNPIWVDLSDTLAKNALVNGFVYALVLFSWWRCSADPKRITQKALLIMMVATVIGIAGSLVMQQVIRWPPPARNPIVQDLFVLHSRVNENPNSFPSDSAMLYSIIAAGVATWKRRLGAALFIWILIFIGPTRMIVGGHYPTDIVVGILLGVGSFGAAKVLARSSFFVRFSEIQSPWIDAIIFLWIFEVGTEFGEPRMLLNAASHILHHHVQR